MNQLRKLVERQLAAHLHRQPVIGHGVYIARGAVVLGDVTLGDYSSVWYNTVLRGDINRIIVGHHTNLQDNVTLHLADEYPCVLGSHVTVGHSAVVHGCRVGDGTLVGIGAIILDGAVIGRECLIGAGALVTPGARVPAGSLALGTPARATRTLTRTERNELRASAMKYAHYAAYCLKNGIGVGGPLAS